jgi:ABC-type microcin C transport system permease subunit YejE
MAQNTLRNVLIGVLSGILSGTLCLILVYVSAVVIIAIQLRELFATLLAAFTVLPLLILLILSLPTLFMGVLVGLVSATTFRRLQRTLSYIAAAALGVVLAELLLAFALPRIAPPTNGDFISMASKPYLVGIFGLILGILCNAFCRKLSPP